MTGQELKVILSKCGKSHAELAAALGISRQNFSGMLNVADVRTGLIEKLSKILDVPLSYFYGSGVEVSATNNSVAVNGSENNVSVDAALVGIIDRQSKQISDLIGIIAKQNQNVQ